MKTFYIIVLFLIIFQMSILMISTFGLFPYGFYSDFDTEELASHSTPQGMLTYLFEPPGGLPGWFNIGDFTIPALIAVFLGIGTITSIFLQSYIPVTLVVVGLFFVPMVTKSYGFFNQLFYYGNSQALIYFGLLIGIVILVIAVITIVEMPTHGGS